VPRPGTNYMPDWATWKPRDSFVMARAEVDMTDWLTMYAAGGYHRSENFYQYVSPRITNVGGLGNWSNPALKGYDIFENYASDIGFRASGHTGPIHHLFTMNYSTFDRDYTSFGRSGGIVSSNLYNPVPIPLPNFTAIVQNLNTQTTMSSVGIADTMSMFGDRLQLIVGARRQAAGADSQTFTPPPASSHFDIPVWSPGYAIIVKPVENVSLYANYIEGLKVPEVVSGVTTYSNIGEILPPAQTKQTEAGAKIDMGRITFTGSYFDITAPNAAAVAVPGRLPARKLIGEQRNRGIELYTFGELAPWFRVLGGVTFINGEVVSQSYTFAGAGGAIFNYNGKTPVGVSTVNANFGVEWDTPFVDGLTLTGRVIYTGESYADDANTQLLPEWTRVDLGARYTFLSPWNGKPIVIRAAVENVFNEAYYNSYRTVSSAVSLGAPRTYLVSTTFNF
jgi:iron complex outermembrane receptor protein